MIIRKPIKLKAYRLSYIYKNESYSKYKNNLLLHNLTSNYELHKKMNLKNTYNPNLTELKELSTKNSLLTKSKLSGITQNIYSSKKSILKPNSIKMDNLLIKNSINNSLMPKNSYKAINTSFNIKKSNKSNKNIFNKKKLLYNNNYIFLPKLKGSKSKKFSMSLYEKEQKKQRDKYNEKLREKLSELEECEKKFDIEILNTLSKLNDEGHKLYEL